MVVVALNRLKKHKVFSAKIVAPPTRRQVKNRMSETEGYYQGYRDRIIDNKFILPPKINIKIIETTYVSIKGKKLGGEYLSIPPLPEYYFI